MVVASSSVLRNALRVDAAACRLDRTKLLVRPPWNPPLPTPHRVPRYNMPGIRAASESRIVSRDRGLEIQVPGPEADEAIAGVVLRIAGYRLLLWIVHIYCRVRSAMPTVHSTAAGVRCCGAGVETPKMDQPGREAAET